MKKVSNIFIFFLITITVSSQITVKESFAINEPYILTPEPSPKPKINGAKVFGVHPGNPVIFTVSATGNRPMIFTTKNLPEGLSLEKSSGRFSGSIKIPGSYTVKIYVKNESGTDERDLHIIVGDKLALTPPMGWNSWNGWGDYVTAENVRATADAMVKTGLINHGWTNVNIDIGWEGKRGGKYNAIQPKKEFPDMKGLCDYVHSLGLKTGIYSTPWTRTYFGYTGGSSDNKDGVQEEIEISKESNVGHYVGKYKFDKNDVRQWEEWGIDYLKYDWCNSGKSTDSVDHIRYMADALISCKRDIVFSLSHCFDEFDRARGKLLYTYIQLWRTGGDIRDVWDNSMLEKDKWAVGLTDIWDSYANSRRREFQEPGNWADPDMLVVGWVGFGDKELHKTRLTPDEQYTHISLWCLWSAPLFIGSPVEKLDKFTISILSNDEVIEIDQDPLGMQAVRVYKEGESEVWVKSMEDGSKAVGLFNRSTKELMVGAPWAQLGLNGKQRVRDLWRQKDLGSFEKVFEAKVPSHGVMLVRMFPE